MIYLFVDLSSVKMEKILDTGKGKKETGNRIQMSNF